MSYRCGICPAVVPSGKTRLTHRVLRPDGTIAREIPVCESCSRVLADGATVKSLLPGSRLGPPEPQFTPIKVGRPQCAGGKNIVPTGD